VEGADTRGPMQVIDLSEGGCFVATTDRYAAGVQLTLQIRLGVSDVALTGRVAHLRPGRGFAVEFAGLPQSALQRLEDFLFQRA
jgi:Tfp pilus assembly protein PilZ